MKQTKTAIYSTKNITCLKYVQNNKMKKLTSICLLMNSSSMTHLFPFLAYVFFKTWNACCYVCLLVYSNDFLELILIDKRVPNPDKRRYVVPNGMSTDSAVSQCLGNITIVEHQYSSKVLLSKCI